MLFLKSNKINELRFSPNLVFAPFRYLAKVLSIETPLFSLRFYRTHQSSAHVFSSGRCGYRLWQRDPWPATDVPGVEPSPAGFRVMLYSPSVFQLASAALFFSSFQRIPAQA